MAILCRNTTEAINHLAYRLRLAPTDVVVTTVVEHHANLLPWGRTAERRYVECGPAGTFSVDDVVAALDAGGPPPSLLAITGASNVTGWLPPLDDIIDAAHERGVPVLIDAAQLAPHRPLPATADYLAFSGHKLYAPFGSGALIGPRSLFETGDPFLAGGGAVDLVDLDEVIWTAPPDREEAGSPNVVGAVALHAAIDALHDVGWDALAAHESALATRLHAGLSAIDGVRLLGPKGRAGGNTETPVLPVAAFTVDGIHHALVAARLSAEYGIAVRHGCSAPTPTWCASSVSAPPMSTPTAPTWSQATTGTSPVRSGRARGWAPRVRTSMRCSPPWPISPRVRRHRFRTTRTRRPATSFRSPTSPARRGAVHELGAACSRG